MKLQGDEDADTLTAGVAAPTQVNDQSVFSVDAQNGLQQSFSSKLTLWPAFDEQIKKYDIIVYLFACF